MTRIKLKDYHITPVFCLAVYILVFISSYIKTGAEYSANKFLSLLVIQIMIFVMPAIIYKRIKGPISYKELGVRPFGATGILLVICAAVFMFCAAVLMGLGSKSTAAPFSANITEIPVSGIVYTVMLYCLLPAIVEEITFRSVIYGEYRKFGVIEGALLSSVLFALMHFSLNGFFTYFLCGVVLALIYEVTHSVFASMAAHFIYNILSVFSHKLLNDAAARADSLIPFIFIFAAAMLLFLFFSLSRAQRLLEIDAETVPESQNEKFPPLAERLRTLLVSALSPGYVLCLAFAFFAGIMKIRGQL